MIIEPKEQRQKEAMTLFIVAKKQFHMGLYETSVEGFKKLTGDYDDTEYARVGRYYQALAYLGEQKYDDAINTLQQYLQNPANALPAATSLDRIQLLLGGAFFDSRKFKEAKQSFEKISDPSLIDTRNYYLQEIAKSLNSPIIPRKP